VWFELRWGITGCLLLTVALITTVFYNHPSTSNVTIFFRIVSILPETNGRVAEIFVGASEPVAKGTPIFRLDSSKREAAVESARRKIAETEAQILVARWDVVKADGELRQANSERQHGGRTRGKAGALSAQPGQRSISRDRAPAGTRARAAWRDRRGDRDETKRRAENIDAATSGESYRRSRTCRGLSRAGQDGDPCRSERAGGAIPSAGRRRRQSLGVSSRHPDPRGRRLSIFAGRFRPDRGLKS
jgi:multidrug resistance efflux pump